MFSESDWLASESIVNIRKMGHEMRGMLQYTVSVAQVIREISEHPKVKELATNLIAKSQEAGKNITALIQEDSLKIPSLRCLVVEDDKFIREELCRSVGKQSHKVIGEASSGKEMIDLALNEKPDLIIFDINLLPPITNGLDALGEIVKTFPDIMAIAITGSEDNESVSRAVDEWVFSYLLKPITDFQLTASIQVTYGRWQHVQILKKENAELKVDLAESRLVNKAKHVMMKRLGWNEEMSFQFIRHHAMDNRMKMIDVAQLVVDGKL